MLKLETKLELASQYLQQQLKLKAPKDSWNLTDNAIRLVQIAPNHWRIRIGGEPAPYAIYTNEKHNIARGVYAGRDNFHWVNDTVNECLPYIQSIMGGTVTPEDIEKAIADTESAIKDLRQQQIDLIGGNEQ